MKNYKVELKVLSAIHIGSGSYFDISKCDYIRLPNQNKIIIIDEKKLFSILCDMCLEEQYFMFIENPNIKKNNLYDFLMSQRGFSNGVCMKLIEEVKKYELDFYEDKFYGIKTFVKDKMSGKVYIPGSTIKGMISTALLTNEILKNINTPDDLKLAQEQTKKIMSKISISDSSLIDLDNLFVSKVIYTSPRNCKSLNQYYEMLKPGTTTSFNLTININDEGIIQKIKNILNNYCLRYEKFYAESFSNSIRITKPEENAVKCYIGAKTGFPTKTFYYQKYQQTAPQKVAKILDSAFKKLAGKHINIKGKSPSCIKCVKINDEIVENGAVQLKFEQLREF